MKPSVCSPSANDRFRMNHVEEGSRIVCEPQAEHGKGDELSREARKTGAHGCGPLILDFRKLAQDRNEFFIRLDGETYRLQLTRNNKLILTK